MAGSMCVFPDVPARSQYHEWRPFTWATKEDDGLGTIVGIVANYDVRLVCIHCGCTRSLGPNLDGTTAEVVSRSRAD